MWIALLGPLEAAGDDGGAVVVSGVRLRGLLALLALDAGQWASNDRVAGALWPGGPVAANTVQSLVSRLRGVLSDRKSIESGPGGYRLAIDPDDVDVHRFTRLAADGRRALSAEAYGRAAADLRGALDLWRAERADALDGVADDAVARLSAARTETALDLAEAELGLGRAAAVLPDIRALAEAAPLAERAQAQLMRALAATGRQADALAVFDRTRHRLADELGVDPSPLLAETHRTVLRGTPVAAPRRDNNLPAALTSFIGRDDDLAAIGAMLGPSRLVTLTGPGGAGKTRLAIGAASRADGDVRLVELAPVADPAEIPFALLTALDMHDTLLAAGRRGGPPVSGDPVDRLIAGLRRRPTLLVLDNCEHLVQDAATITARLLLGCPDLRVLATSREPLGLTGEALYPVAPLPYPERATTPDDALTYPAVRLFADRARSARPDFAVTPGNLTAVLDICRRLDGLPLAVELAAARLRGMTPEEIAARLGARFRLLTGGDRAALPRHRTLRAVVDWSWDLLDEPERALLSLLSVFAGGATLDAVEAVCAGDPLDALTSLVDRSLVVHGADGRYRLLETIREYGAERLTGDPAAAHAVHLAHAAYYLARAEDDEPRMRTGEQIGALERTTVEYDNLIGALRWATRAGEASTAVRLVASIGWYWWLRGRRVDGAQAAVEALAVEGPVEPVHRALAYVVCAFNAFEAGPAFGTVVGYVDKAIEVRDANGLRETNALLRMVDLLSIMIREPDETTLAKTVHLLEDADPWLRATSHSFHGALLVNRGNLELAVERLVVATDLFTAIGDRWGLSFALAELAEVSLWRGDLEVSADAFGRALKAEDELGAEPGLSQMRIRHAVCRSLIDPPDVASRRMEDVLADARASVEHNNIAHAGVAYAKHLHRIGDLDGATRVLDEMELELPLCQGPPHLDAMHAEVRALVLLDRGRFAEARELAAKSAELAVETTDGPILAGAVAAMAATAMGAGDAAGAAALLGEAELMRGTRDLSSAETTKATAAAREALGNERFEEIYAEALAQSRDEVITRLGNGREPWSPAMTGWT